MTDFDKVLAMAGFIKSTPIREYTETFLRTKVPEYFKTIPSSSSGKYHPSFANGVGGLMRHTIAVAYIVHQITGLQFLRFRQKDRDRLLSAALLHDTFKQGETQEGTGSTMLMDHAKIAASKIEDDDIAALVLSHMGEWGMNKPGNWRAFILHLADYIASRKYITIEIPEEYFELQNSMECK